MVGRVSSTERVHGAGASFAVELHGEGAPLLFVHGFPLDRGMWSHQLAQVTGWRCIAPDLRGAGASDAPANGYGMVRYADDLQAICDALGVASAVCCGFSMGGYVLFEFLRRYSKRVRALILCDTKAAADTVDGKRVRDEHAALVEDEGLEALAERLLPKLLGATTWAQHPDVTERVRAMVLRQPSAGVVGALRAMRDRPDSTSLLSAIAVPTLVVCGAEDTVTPPIVARGMVERIAGARYVEVEGAGHLSPLERPDRVSGAMQSFLAGL